MAAARAKKKRSSRRPAKSTSSWLSHRQLLFVEAVLLVGLGKEGLEWMVLEASGLPAIYRVLLGMFVVASTLGGLVYAAQGRLLSGLDRTHKALRRRVPVPQLLFHALALSAIFLAYAVFWDQETGVLAELASATEQAAEKVSRWVAGGDATAAR